MPGMGQQGLPPPPELLRYKNLLLILSAAYAVILVAGIAVGGTPNSIFYVLLLAAMLLMALRSDQCMSQCVMPFVMFAMLIVLQDAMFALTILARDYPPASKIFSTSCPREVGIILKKDTVVYLDDSVVKPGCADNYTIHKATKVNFEENECDERYVIGNVLVIVATALDVIAAVLSFRMFKTALGAVQLPDAGQPMMPPGGMAGPGGMGPPGGGGGGPGGMSPPGAGPAADQRGGNFRAFQGPGQTLSG